MTEYVFNKQSERDCWRGPEPESGSQNKQSITTTGFTTLQRNRYVENDIVIRWLFVRPLNSNRTAISFKGWQSVNSHINV